MQRYELDAWLGDEHGLTGEQVADLLATAEDIAVRYPDPDDADDREAALTVAYRVMVEDPEVVVAELGERLARARRAEHYATVAVRQAALSLVRQSGKGDRGVTTEGGFARVSLVDRQTVLKWLGKR